MTQLTSEATVILRKSPESATSSATLAGTLSIDPMKILSISPWIFLPALTPGLFAAADASPITFNRDIAPVVIAHCAPCHHAGGAGPFPLIHFADVRKRAKQIAEITGKRVMPPWLPAAGHGEFIDSRRLDDAQVLLFQRWLDDGTQEGTPEYRPPDPVFPSNWQLGTPDLVVKLAEPFHLGPDGKDLYRNFVIPLPLNSNRFVRAFEFRPGNPSIHHVRLLLDGTKQCRRLDETDAESGFGGMRVPARHPPGRLLTWTPGRQPRWNEPEQVWAIDAGDDLVLQIHMQRTGKEESIQPQIAFYFTDNPPTQTTFMMGLVTQLIDIPAGATNYSIIRKWDVPVDISLLAVMPHAHYLASEVRLSATLPDGKEQFLLWIPRWDFNWQEEYRYRKPVFLPRGTRVDFSIRYDNSEANIRNPNRPPKPVGFGPQSSDEMGEVWLQVLPENPADLTALQRQKRSMDARESAAFYERFLESHPDDSASHFELGKVLGPLGRKREAATHFQRSLELNPSQPEAHYYLGVILFEQQNYKEARSEFERELGINPGNAKAHVSLALVSIDEQDLKSAEAHLRAALQLNSTDPATRQMLDRVIKARDASNP